MILNYLKFISIVFLMMNDKIKLLENSFEGEEFKRQREFLFDNYVAQNIERFVVEFNSRMEKFNVYFVYIKL